MTVATPRPAGSRALRSPLFALVPYMAGERAGIMWTAVVGLFNNLAPVALAVTGSYVVALAVVRHHMAEPQWWFAGTLAVLLRAVLTWHEMDVSHSVAYRILAALRMALFDGYSRGVPSRRRGQHTGRLAATAMGDVEKLEFFYAHTAAQLASGGVLLGAGVAVLLAIEPAVGLTVLAGTAGIFAVTLPFLPRSVELGESLQDARADLSALVVDVLSGTREILGFGLQHHVYGQLAGQAARVDTLQRSLASFLALAGSLRELCVLATVVGVFLAAVSQDGLDPLWVPPLVAGALALLAPLAEGAATLSQLQPQRASARRVLEGIRLQADATLPARPMDFRPEGPLGVEITGLRFAYDGGEPALGPLSLVVAPGEILGIRGRSGAGKSTLAHLLLRLWAPDSGSIVLTDAAGRRMDIGRVAESRFRSMVTLVEQDGPVFHGSVLENMRLAVPQIPAEEVEAALALVGLPLEGARWTAGVDTVLGEQGTSLSGGERARFCLARALLLRPKLLVLDEITASLDEESERTVIDVVSGLRGSTTVVMVSHRESTLAACTRTVSLG